MSEHAPNPWPHARIGLLFCLAIAVVAICTLGGCGVALGPDGSAYWGWNMGAVAETGEQILAQGSKALLGGMGVPAAIAGPAALLGTMLLRRTKQAAVLEGKEKGWMEREAASQVQQPLAPPQSE